MSLKQNMLQKILSDTVSIRSQKGRVPKRSRSRKPRILVLANHFDYCPDNRFGLWGLLQTLSTAPEVITKPIFTLAHRSTHPTPTIVIGSQTHTILTHYNFATAPTPVTPMNYDHVWIFGISNWGQSLEPAEVSILSEFMRSGGGVFGTGDFESPSGRIPPRAPRKVR